MRCCACPDVPGAVWISAVMVRKSPSVFGALLFFADEISDRLQLCVSAAFRNKLEPERHFHSSCEPLQGTKRRVRVPALYFADVALGNPCLFLKFFLGHSGTHSCVNHCLNGGILRLQGLILLADFGILKLFPEKIIKFIAHIPVPPHPSSFCGESRNSMTYAFCFTLTKSGLRCQSYCTG